MKAAVLRAFNQPLEFETQSVPKPGTGEVLLKVSASGICGTDLHIQDGKIAPIKLPHILGHETAGVVVEIGDEVDQSLLGKLTIVAIDRICHHCLNCLSGRTNLCHNLKRYGFELAGGFQEYMLVSADNLFLVEGIEPEQAAIIPDAVACMYRAIVTQGKVQADDLVCILGMGGLGFQGVQIARSLGAKTVCTSRNEIKLDISKKLGADYVFNTKDRALDTANLLQLTQSLCDVVIDIIGSVESIGLGLKILRPGGKLISVGYDSLEFKANYQELIISEKEIIGSRGSTRQDLLEAVNMVNSGCVIPFVNHCFDFEAINAGLAFIRSGQSLGRVVLQYPQKGKGD
jgi:2-desacetyl-2-hydroxyethyl bacteriochlorophyllide A dehydrogenase